MPRATNLRLGLCRDMSRFARLRISEVGGTSPALISKDDRNIMVGTRCSSIQLMFFQRYFDVPILHGHLNLSHSDELTVDVSNLLWQLFVFLEQLTTLLSCSEGH